VDANFQQTSYPYGIVKIRFRGLGEGGDFQNPEASGLMQRTELSFITNVSAEH
jgi:hypothetical protein